MEEFVLKKLAQIDISVGSGENEVNIPDTDLSQASFTTVVDIVFGVLGMVAFVVIVFAGLQFVLSRGEPEKAAKARRTVIYTAVGIAIGVSAFAIVRFIVGAI